MRPTTALRPPFDDLLPTKLRPPRLRETHVSRARLVEMLDAARGRVTTVVAPAGFGKSTLLAAWADDCDQPMAWLSLDSRDDALPRFLVYLTAALTAIDHDLTERVRQQALTSNEPELNALYAAVLYQVARSSPGWTMVLDNCEVITQDDVHAFLSELVAALPAGCRLILASRVELRIPSARLRLLGDLTELTADDLRATESEAAGLLAAHQITLSEAELAATIARTQGWMAVLQCVVLAYQHTAFERVGDALARDSERLELLRDYLLREVIDQLPRGLRTFLLRISILDRLSVKLCAEVTEEPATERYLDRARRSSLFLVSLDERGEWFQFHPLFRDFLHGQLLAESDPEAIRALHAAAANWHRRHDLLDEAIDHAVAAQEWGATAEMLTVIGTEMIVQHRLHELFGWIERMPVDVVLAHANVSTLWAYALIRQGRVSQAAPFLDNAEREWSSPPFRMGLALVEMIRSAQARFRGDSAGVVRHAANAIALATGEQLFDGSGALAYITPRLLRFDGTWIANLPLMLPYMQVAAGLARLGRMSDATRLADTIESAYHASGLDVTATYFAPEIAWRAIAQGRLTFAEGVARKYAVSELSDAPIERAFAKYQLARVLYEWNRLEEAEALLRAGIASLQQIGASVRLPELHLQLVQTLWAAGENAHLPLLLDRATETATALNNIPLQRDVAALRARFAIAAGDWAYAQWWAARRMLASNTELGAVSVAELLTYARLLISTSEVEAAATLLARLRDEVEQQGRIDDLIHVLALQSMVCLDLHLFEQAAEALGKALALGEAEGYQRVFLDEGEPMLRLLRIAHRRGVMVEYIQSLLAATGHEPQSEKRVIHPDLVEPITAREIEVLGLMAIGLTIREISVELFLSLATVKRHIANVYGKLDVSSRSDAVQRARALGILSSQSRPLADLGAKTEPDRVVVASDGG